MESESINGLVIFILTSFTWEYFLSYQRFNKFEKAYWGERKGRTRVEKEMKRIANIQLNTKEGFFIQPIGIISSCYRNCLGTPRQGLLVPSSRSSLTLTKNISPESLVGLQEFSHVWITFKFHLNTNTLKESKAFSNGSTFNAKIALPVLRGKAIRKIGVFGTRSPHRPNPVGVTLAKIDRIDKLNRTVYLNACDLVDGTPVFDIKPYVPAYDTVTPYHIPSWIEESVGKRNIVTITETAKNNIYSIQNKLVQYKNNPEQFIAGLTETIEADIRSQFQTRKMAENTANGSFIKVPFDETICKYVLMDEGKFEIVE
eukprot:gene8203-11097_t